MKEQKKEVTKAEMLYEVETALRKSFKGRVLLFVNELHLFKNGQLFILTLQKFDPRKIPPVE